MIQNKHQVRGEASAGASPAMAHLAAGEVSHCKHNFVVLNTKTIIVTEVAKINSTAIFQTLHLLLPGDQDQYWSPCPSWS